MSLPDTVARFVAETRPFDGPIDASTGKVRGWGRATEAASLQARKALLSASDAADRAAKSQLAAKDAADKLAKGEIDEAEAAKAAARAAKDLERASIAQREAQRAAADAAEKAARQYRQEARDAQLAATAQMLGALKAKGSVEQYNNVLRQAERIHGDLSKTALSSFQAMQKEGTAAAEALSSADSSLGEMNKLITVGVANGLTMLPGAAAVAADGITLALGAAIAGVGLKFAAQNKAIRADYASLGHYMSSELTKDAQPFVRTLQDIEKQAKVSFGGWEPQIRSMWADMAPEVSKFATSAIRSLDELKPALESVTRGFNAQLNALSGEAGPAMHNIATGISAIGDAAARNPQALAQMVNDVSLLVRYTGDGIGALVRYKNEVDSFMNVFAGGGPMGLIHFIAGIDHLGSSLTGTDHSLQIGGGSFATFGQQAAGAVVHTSALAKDMQTLASNTADATSKANALTDAFARLLNPAEAVFTDTGRLKQSIADMTAALKKSHGSLNDNTAAARQSKAAFTGMIDSAKALAGDLLNDHRSLGQVQSALIPYINSMYRAAGSNREARALVDAFVRSLGMVPPTKGTTLKSNAASAKAQVDAYQRSINALHGKSIDIYQTFHTTYERAYAQVNYYKRMKAAGGIIERASGGPVGLADGGPSGMVVGPGTGTSDSIPALLSNGEYVVNARQTHRHRALLEAINAGMDGFAGGGVTGTPIFRARMHPSMLAAMAAQQSLAALRRSPEAAWAAAGLGAGVGSGHGTVVQHVSVTVNVGGSIRSDRDIVAMIQQALLRNRIATSLPAGR